MKTAEEYRREMESYFRMQNHSPQVSSLLDARDTKALGVGQSAVARSSTVDTGISALDGLEQIEL